MQRENNIIKFIKKWPFGGENLLNCYWLDFLKLFLPSFFKMHFRTRCGGSHLCSQLLRRLRLKDHLWPGVETSLNNMARSLSLKKKKNALYSVISVTLETIRSQIFNRVLLCARQCDPSVPLWDFFLTGGRPVYKQNFPLRSLHSYIKAYSVQ